MRTPTGGRVTDQLTGYQRDLLRCANQTMTRGPTAGGAERLLEAHPNDLAEHRSEFEDLVARKLLRRHAWLVHGPSGAWEQTSVHEFRVTPAGWEVRTQLNRV
jgi:hypothetical protein